MKRTGLLRSSILAAVLIFTFAAPSAALDSRTIRDISRASTAEDLSRLADDITSNAATRRPRDFEEGTQIASEVSAYLLYIIARQNALLLEK